MKEKLLVVFCASSSDIDSKYNQAAREFVRAACLSGYGIVSGGAVKGTMKIVADEAAACGATNIGVIPRFMKGVEYPNLTELKWTDTMAENKEKSDKQVIDSTQYYNLNARPNSLTAKANMVAMYDQREQDRRRGKKTKPVTAPEPAKTTDNKEGE